MKSAVPSKPAGQQLAEAVLATALTVPLVFAVGELRDSRLLRDSLPPAVAEASRTLDSTPRPNSIVAASAPILARRDGRTLAANKSGAEPAKRETPNKQESVQGTDPGHGKRSIASAASPEDAAAPRRDSVGAALPSD
jgi:hypothetical protein